MHRPWQISALLIFLLLPARVCAQQDSPTQSSFESSEMMLFQNIPSVYGASRYEQQSKEAPSFVSVVTADDIKKFGYRTLAEILRSVPGFFITYDRNYQYVGVRGFGRPGDYNTRVLLLVDGHRVNDNVFDQAAIGTDFIVDVDVIERVEVIRGPASSLYGANAFLGVVNVITRRGRELRGTEVSGEAASFGTYKGRLSYGNRFQNGLEVLASGSYLNSRGRNLYFKEFDHPSTNNGMANGCDDDQFHSLFSRLSYSDFSFEGAYVSREKGIPTGSFGTVFNDSRNRTTDDRLFLDLKYDHNFDDQWGFLARTYLDKYDYDGTYVYDYGGPIGPRNLVSLSDSARGVQWGSEVQGRKTFFQNHMLIAGAEYRDNIRQDQSIYQEGFVLDDKRDSNVFAIYLQDEYRILNNLILNAGVRHDQYSVFGGSTNPRLALLYYPLERTTFKVLYGSAFRPPNVFELYSEDGSTQKANPNLKPETINTYELVWEQYLGNNIRLTAAGFHYEIEDLISQEEDPADKLFQYRNAGTIAANGLEVELERRWGNGINTRLSYSFEMAETQATGQSLTNLPEQMAKFNLLLPVVSEKLFAGLELHYMSKRKTLGAHHVDDFLITNLTLFSRNLYKGLEISASAYNLFDVDYGDPGAEDHLQDVIKQDGVSFRLKVTYSF